ncbi:MAG: V-type ATP synthase subunit K [Clostridia bacterium]|nr:V-type ATP synthase subunit K [Clostridia bacterium]
MASIFTNGSIWAILGAVCAVLFAGMGSAKGIQLVGKAGSGVLSEAPETFGRVLILQALPGTQGIYGLLVAFLILFSNGDVFSFSLPLEKGFAYFLAALPIAVVGYFSAVHQGTVAAAAMGIVAKRPEESMKGVISAGLVETYAVLALLISVLAIFNI